MSKDPQLATLHELQTIYDISDLHDFLEMLDAKDAITELAETKAKAKQASEQQKANNKPARRRR